MLPSPDRRGAGGEVSTNHLRCHPQRPDQLLHLFLGCERGQGGGRGRFQVDRNAIRQLDGASDVGRLGAGEQLEMDVAAEIVLAPDQLDGRQHLIHRSVGADHAGAEEDALHDPGALHQIERTSQLVGREFLSADVAPRAKGAVVTVVLTRAGLEHLEHRHALSPGRLDVGDVGEHVGAGGTHGFGWREETEVPRRIAGTRGTQGTRWANAVVEAGGLTQQVQFFADVHGSLLPAVL
ncbi:MAG: hypothetical protein NT169_06560 [Chloroflexi bacterium]|nr:hypothetical protein [Chloroflexota bacterium]